MTIGVKNKGLQISRLFFHCFAIALVLTIVSKAGNCDNILDRLINDYNSQLNLFQQTEAELSWNISLGENVPWAWIGTTEVSIAKSSWNKAWCRTFRTYIESAGELPQDVGHKQEKIIQSVCESQGFQPDRTRKLGKILMRLESDYNSMKINGMRIEPDVSFKLSVTRDEKELKDLWMTTTEETGKVLKPNFVEMVRELNSAVQSQGYKDMGDIWLEELGIENAGAVAMDLWNEVKPLYRLLHAFVRYKLAEFYKQEINATVPVHLLRNLWGQRWDSLIGILLPPETGIVTEEKGLNFTSIESMLTTIENFYVSMGFPSLPKSVRENSQFFYGKYGKRQHKTSKLSCHGSALNMYREQPWHAGNGDYRILMCAGEKLSLADLHILSHEIGHVYYFMAASSQPAVFQQGPPEFHEAIGDSITFKLHDPGNGKKPTETEFIKYSLQFALERIPQIPFGLVLDMWRWKVFRENNQDEWNNYWWQLNKDFLGISPPAGYSTHGLDALTKFHVVQNMPYSRYFFASFLQLQFLQAYCEPEEMHECKLRGNVHAGAKLWRMLSKGTSVDWTEALDGLTGSRKISAKPLLKFFEPLESWLKQRVHELNITVGW